MALDVPLRAGKGRRKPENLVSRCGRWLSGTGQLAGNSAFPTFQNPWTTPGSLTLAYETVNVGDGFAGTWFVLEGTGVFADATGSGDLFLVGTGPGSTGLGAGVVELAGTISL